MSDLVINVSEDKLLEFGSNILDILLEDKTTGRNIIWATDDYIYLGEEYYSRYPITVSLITGHHANVIQPRIAKAKQNQTARTKEKAEVFTPAWVCNEQNNLVDKAWFGKENIFNSSGFKTWTINTDKIPFGSKKGERWQDYVDAKRLEITCGEAPYLTSRYDMATGKYIPVDHRIGLLDRKIRVVNENVADKEEWLIWTFRALESIYGFEYQGDSLLIARENILYTFIENVENSLQRKPSDKEMRRAAHIIAWNIWQMDGLSFTVPFGTLSEPYRQISFMDMDLLEQKQIYCKIHDWRLKETLFYKSLIKEK